MRDALGTLLLLLSCVAIGCAGGDRRVHQSASGTSQGGGLTTEVEGCRFAVLPQGDPSDVRWQELREVARIALHAPADVNEEALALAEQWIASLVERSSSVFRTPEPESMQALTENASERRAFMDAWLTRESPVLVMAEGRFVLAPAVAESFAAWSLQVGDTQAAARWLVRGARSDTPSACAMGVARVGRR